MSNLNLEKVTIIPLPITKNYHLLTKHESEKKTICVFMTYITEEEENKLDNSENIIIDRGDISFDIKPNNVYCYGSVDFSTDSSDYNIIDDFDFLKHLNDAGVKIPSDYNYKEHACYSPLSRCRWTETWSPAELAQLAYSYIGKPERIVLFKHVM